MLFMSCLNALAKETNLVIFVDSYGFLGSFGRKSYNIGVGKVFKLGFLRELAMKKGAEETPQPPINNGKDFYSVGIILVTPTNSNFHLTSSHSTFFEVSNFLAS